MHVPVFKAVCNNAVSAILNVNGCIVLFNAGLEHAMRKWKTKLVHHGVQLGHGSRLTNIRYADDLMLLATSSNDLIYMLETLIPELAACRLQLNSAKTKILTTSPSESSEFVDVCGEMVQVIHAETVHKYLGRNLGGSFLARRNSEFAHRLQEQNPGNVLHFGCLANF